MATNNENLPVPPLSVGEPGEGTPRVVSRFEGKRDVAITSDLRNVLEFAARAANVEVVIYSGGQPSAAEATRIGTSASGEPIYSDRTGSTRHDHGNAADLRLYQGGKLLNFQNADDRNVISAFISASIAAGATGVGAGIGYMGPSAVHVGFGPNGVKGGPVMTWGAGGASANAPAWLVESASPAAVRTTIATLQTSLKALGYLDGPVDGLYGEKTIAAVNSYARATGARTLSLNTMPAGYQPFLGPGVKQPLPEVAPARPSAAPVPIGNLTAAIANGGRLRKGSSGEAVRELQTFLNAQGATDAKGRALTVDGDFGPRTRQAVAAYQATHPELRRDAVVGPRTAAAIVADQAAAVRARAQAAEAARYQGMADAEADARARLGDTARKTAEADAIALERSQMDRGRAADAYRATAQAASMAPESATVASPQDAVAAISANRGAATALALMGTGLTLDQFNARFGGTITPQDFAARFDPTAPAFDGSSGLNQTWNGLPPPRPMGAAQWLWRGFTEQRWDIPDLPAQSYEPAPESLWADNAFMPHDPTDPYQLGGGSHLGTGGALSAPELDAVAGHVRGAAAVIRASIATPVGFGVPGLVPPTASRTVSNVMAAMPARSSIVLPDTGHYGSLPAEPSYPASGSANSAWNASSPTMQQIPGSSGGSTGGHGSSSSGSQMQSTGGSTTGHSYSTSVNYSTGTVSAGYGQGGIGHM